MKIFLLITFLIGFGMHGTAQIKIAGTVNDGTDPLPFCNVVLYDLDSVIITGEVTDDLGKFNLIAPAGDYILGISFIGFVDYFEDILLSKDLDKGIIIMSSLDNQLEAVLVIAQKRLIVRKPDRIIYNLSNSVAAQGSDMSEAIALAPGVTIQNGVVNMIGRGATRVMINGRILQLQGEELLNYLSTIASDDIETIEVITNPPAKYEASGNGGIINIIYKKGKNNSWKNTTTLAFTKNRKGYTTLRNGLQYNRDKHELSISFNGSTGESWNTEFGGTYFPTADQKWNSIYISAEDQIGGRVAYDLHVTDQTQIGVQYQGSKLNPNVNGETITSLGLIKENASLSFVNTGSDDRERYSHVANIHVISNLDTTGKQLSIDADYFHYHQKGNSVFDIEAFDEGTQSIGLSRSRTVNSSQQIKNYSIKADMQHPSKNFNWSYGLKYNRNNSNNDIFNYDRITGESILDPNLTNTFVYHEDISAAYISGAKQVSDRWDVKLGIRLERTSSLGYSVSLDQENRNGFSRLFPTAYFSYNHTQDHQYNMNIGGRVNRASFRDLNPFRIYLTNTAYSEGNPFIQPSYTYTFNFNYVFKGKYTTTAYFNRQQNGFGTLFVPYPEDLVLATLRDNFYDANYFGIGEMFSLDISSKWSTQNQIYLMYHHTSTYNNYDALAQNGFQYYVSNNHNITLGKGWNAQLNNWFSSSAKSNIFMVDATWNVSFGIKKKMLNDKLQIGLNANDVFNQSGLDRLRSEINGLLNSYGQNYSSRNIRLTFSYNFGNEKINVRPREFGNKETQRRS